jgi:hypothetical protein
MSKSEQLSEFEQDAIQMRLIRVAWVKVYKYVAGLQRTFRRALRATGVEPMRSVRGGRPSQVVAGPVKRCDRKPGVRARSVEGVDRRARVAVDLRTEATAARTLSPVERIESLAGTTASTADPTESTGIESESLGAEIVSPVTSMESTVRSKLSTARKTLWSAASTTSTAPRKESPAQRSPSPATANMSPAT